MLKGGKKGVPSEKPWGRQTSMNLQCLPAWLSDKWPQIWMYSWHRAHHRTQSFGRPGKCRKKKIKLFIHLEACKQANGRGSTHFGGECAPLTWDIHTSQKGGRVKSEVSGQDATPKVLASSQHLGVPQYQISGSPIPFPSRHASQGLGTQGVQWDSGN